MVAGMSRAQSGTLQVESTEVVVPPTVMVDAPTRAETKKAFDDVSSVLHSVSSQHEAVRTEMASLSRGLEEMRVAQAGELETTAQVKETLQRTMSASSLLEARLGQAESAQLQMRSTAEQAKTASEQAISQAQRLQEEQAKTTQQVTEFVSSQAEETAKRIQGATSVAMQTQQEVRTLSSLARTADLTAKMASEKVEREMQTVQQELRAQKIAAMEEAQVARSAHDVMNRKLLEAQETIQATTDLSQKYEEQIAALSQKMSTLEQLLVGQRQKGQQLESQLSAAQDRIGGAERRAQLLEAENVKIKGELQSWNDYYTQEETSPETPVSAPVSFPIPIESTLFSFTAPMSIPMATSVSAGAQIAQPHSWVEPPSENVEPQQSSERRVSFGSVFSRSSGGNGNGNGHGAGGNGSAAGTTQQTRTGGSTFNIDIKPKEPPIFYGRAAEDVDTWLSKVADFIYLTEANDRQQVAYMATLLQEAAADWWTSLLKERHGVRPADFVEMSVLLQKRFGSTTRVDRARAALRNIKQGQNEATRAYSTRFEALLSKLPTFDKEWAKTQYIWGLHPRTAELVVIAEPRDLHSAIHQAEKIEMARSAVSSGQTSQGQRAESWNRGRRGFLRGRGKMNAMQSSTNFATQQYGGNVQGQSMVTQNTSMQSTGGRRNAQCYNCNGYGHYAWECPSASKSSQRGGRQMRGRVPTRGRRGGRGRGRRGGRGNPQVPTHATLVPSEPVGSEPELQQAQVPPSVPGPSQGQGN